MTSLSPDFANPFVPSAGNGAARPGNGPNPRILIVDDVADNRAILARRFQRRNFDVVQADGGVKALELIGAEPFDLVLLDVMMPDIGGLEVLRQIRLTYSRASLPVIMVTANNQSADVVSAIEMGANDFVSKPVDFAVALVRVNAQVERKRADEALESANAELNAMNEQLERRVRERTARLSDANQQLKQEMASRQRSEERSQYLAYHDALTGLGNRLLFQEELQRALHESQMSEDPLAILFVDLDGFKNVNDTLGHSVGDGLLKTLASRMLDCLGDTARIARLGGDEFGIIQRSAKQPENSMSLATRIIDLISEPCRVGEHDLSITASIGIVIENGGQEDAETLLKKADLAMYRAKAAGRGVYRIFDPAMDAAAEEAMYLRSEMREALAAARFELHFQPIVSIASGRVSTMEALLRWNHPERGWISPGVFIPIAEDSGMIVQLGEWVIRQACAEAITWAPSVKVAVNLSAIQFQSGNLVPTVVNALATSGLSPARLELEITESVLLDQSERNMAVLRQLRQVGVRISMDDFGTGFSSLSYLRDFPFDKIKIDQSFVRNLAVGDGRSRTIVGAIAGLGISFGMETTAEGVETKEQLECLTGHGCTEIQGYYYSRPVAGSQVKAVIGRINGSN